ncbi:hypothetical protein [Streptomyces kronopolitis]
MLILQTGRRAAFEVTRLAADGAQQTDSILSKDGNSWPSPGRWWWSIQVGSPGDIPRLRECYARIALLCEEAEVDRPEVLWRSTHDDADLSWLVEDSSSQMFGYPHVPSVEGGAKRDVMVVPSARGGMVDRSLSGLGEALSSEFRRPYMAKHLAKVGRAEADERHLFIPIHYSALPFEVADALMVGTVLPTDPPPLPPEVTHLWLAPQFSRRVLLWAPGGWQQHFPYD